MSTDSLPKDPTKAAEILASLQEKDQKETLCRYPTCDLPRVIATGTGRPSAYCGNPEHTPVSNHRARASLRATATGIPEAAASKREASPSPAGGVAPLESLRSSVVNGMMQLQDNLARYIATLAEITDPDLAAAQIQTTLDRAETRIAEAMQNASIERSLRLAADTARTAAQEEAQAEREAAEQAILHMEEAGEKLQRQKEDYEQQIMTIQVAHEQAMNTLRVETEYRIETIERQSQEALTLAQVATAKAQEETKQSHTRTYEIEETARVRVTTAEQLMTEARANLDRERSEVDRLRSELATTVADARAQIETERTQARANLDRERSEVDRLRNELATVRTRADQLLTAHEKLQAELVQVHLKEHFPSTEK